MTPTLYASALYDVRKTLEERTPPCHRSVKRSAARRERPEQKLFERSEFFCSVTEGQAK